MAKGNVRESALDILIKIQKDQAYSNLLLNQTIQKNEIPKQDIGLLTEMVYGTIQRRDTIDYYLEPFLNKQKKLTDWVRNLLRLSVYQMIFLDRVPDHAIINEAVKISKKRGHSGISGLVNGVLRNIQRNGVPNVDDIANVNEKLAISTSHPLWLIKRWVRQYGYEKTEAICKVNLTPPQVTARVNLVKATTEEIIDLLNEERIQAEKGNLSQDAILIKSGNVLQSNTYKRGYLTVQDESSMLVARALGVTEGERILDSCAAPGGKTTHIGELLNNTGKVISVDLHSHKVKLINDQVDRLQLNNVETLTYDSRNLEEKFQVESFDRILVDAPCTGFGVIRRKPDIKYQKTEDDIRHLSSIQLKILTAVAPLLKQGGTLVYSTCTIDEEENSQVVDKFLNDQPLFSQDFTLQDRLPTNLNVDKGMVQILPHEFNTDGFFIASLRKQTEI